MRIASCLSAGALMLAGASAWAAPLMNGNFESNDAQTPPSPSYWLPASLSSNPAQYVLQYQTSGGNAGTAGVFIQNLGSNNRNYWESSPFDVQAGLTYTLSFDYKSDAILSYPRLDFYAGPGTSVWLAHQDFGDEVHWGLQSLFIATDWTSKSFQFTVPAGATQATLGLNANAQWANTSFDNVSVAVPEPTALGLLGCVALVLGRRRDRA